MERPIDIIKNMLNPDPGSHMDALKKTYKYKSEKNIHEEREMREIKFRAWDKEQKKITVIFDIFSGAIPNITKHDLMQYTGLKDKNGKEIYEGDIILIGDTETEPITDDGRGPTNDANHLSPVIFISGCFGVDILERGDCFNKKFYSFDTVRDEVGETEFEIIGNIYENPELLSNNPKRE